MFLKGLEFGGLARPPPAHAPPLTLRPLFSQRKESLRRGACFTELIDSGLVGASERVPREQKMLKGHLPRVIHHQVYQYTMKIVRRVQCVRALHQGSQRKSRRFGGLTSGYKTQHSEFQIRDSGFGFRVFRFRVSCFGIREPAFGIRIVESELQVSDFGFRGFALMLWIS